MRYDKTKRMCGLRMNNTSYNLLFCCCNFPKMQRRISDLSCCKHVDFFYNQKTAHGSANRCWFTDYLTIYRQTLQKYMKGVT